MPVFILWSTMNLLVWVEVWAGGSAAVGVVTKLVNMHSTLGIGVIALDVVRDDSRGGLGLLGKSHGASDTRVTTENGN